MKRSVLNAGLVTVALASIIVLAIKVRLARPPARHLNAEIIATIQQNIPKKTRVSVRSVPDPEAETLANEIVTYMEARAWSVGRLSGGTGPGLPPITSPLQFRRTTFPIDGIEIGVGRQP
jgi:hypothetical protein